MGWKLVRDRNEQWCRANGVSGQWRTCSTPVLSLTKKLLEECGEWAESGDPDELYDLRDVLDRLLILADPDGAAHSAHAAKIAEMGGFGQLIEWTPVPAATDMGYLSLPAKVQADIEEQVAQKPGGSLNPTPDCGGPRKPRGATEVWWCDAHREFHGSAADGSDG